MGNEPCHGCWWKEGGRCYQDKLAHVHGIEKAPRNGIGASGNGLVIDDALLTECISVGGHASKNAVYSKFAKQLEDAGISVVRVSIGGKP